MNNIQKLNEIGQSIWLDNIHRKMLESGGLNELIEQGVLGVTSNPSIFEKAITASSDYDEQLQQLVVEDRSITAIYDALVLEDIQQAADILRPVFEETEGLDGYVSLEVSPELAHDSDKTVAEAKRYFNQLGRPNIMIKVPATEAGIPAIESLISSGVNVNVTLIFGLDNYEKVAKAYINGLKTLHSEGGELHSVASVASFFVSRVDTAVDQALDGVGDTELKGKIAIANAKLAYRHFESIFSGSGWQVLAEAGAKVQRPLWASTSTKNPAYPDTLYLDGLIGARTVNTVPPGTLDAFLDHGQVVETLSQDVDSAEDQVNKLTDVGVDLKAVTDKLQQDGVEAFAKSYRNLLAAIGEKCESLKAVTG